MCVHVHDLVPVPLVLLDWAHSTPLPRALPSGIYPPRPLPSQLNSLGDLDGLRSCKKLTMLSLLHNEVVNKQYYRLYAINLVPSLKQLDFQKVTIKVNYCIVIEVVKLWWTCRVCGEGGFGTRVILRLLKSEGSFFFCMVLQARPHWFVACFVIFS